MKNIPIAAAERIAKEYGYHQVIIIGRAVGEGEHVTTYGISKVHCSVAARVGSYIKYGIMGWDDRVKRHDELLEQISVQARIAIAKMQAADLTGLDESLHVLDELLGNGSLCIMAAGMQQTHQHRIPKGSRPCGKRVSLTFRGKA